MALSGVNTFTEATDVAKLSLLDKCRVTHIFPHLIITLTLS